MEEKINKAEDIIKNIKEKEKEIDSLKSKLDELGMAGRKAVYFNMELIGWSYDVKIDRINIRIEGERTRK